MISTERPWLKYYSDAALNAAVPSNSIYDYILEQNKNNMSGIAITYMGKKITYKKLFENIDRVAKAIYALGVRSGDVVPIAIPNVPANVYCMYALNKIGATGDFIDLRSKGEKLVSMLNATKSSIAIICDIFAENAIEIQDKVQIKNWIIVSPFDDIPVFGRLLKLKTHYSFPGNSISWKRLISTGKKTIEENIIVDENAPACIFHTSGTTGVPKGVLMSNRNMNAMTLHYKFGNIPAQKGDTFLNQIPPFLAYNEILSVHMPLALQMSIVMLPDYKPELFLKQLYKYLPNHVTAGPADMRSFSDMELLAKMDFSNMKTIACGSDKLDYDKKKKINELIKSRNGKSGIMEGYGMTEAGSAIVTCWPNAEKPGSVGIPHFMNVVSVFSPDDFDEELENGEKGEICVYGPTVMLGYYNNSVDTDLVLKQHSDGNVWLHTGDLGHMDEDGFVYIDGRIKRLVIRHDGIKVSPFEIEQIIKMVEGIKDVCVVGIRDKNYDSGDVPVAFVVVDDDVNYEEILHIIKEKCEKQLSDNYRPYKYQIIKELPLTPNGKVDYRTLEKYSN